MTAERFCKFTVSSACDRAEKFGVRLKVVAKGEDRFKKSYRQLQLRDRIFHFDNLIYHNDKIDIAISTKPSIINR